MIFNRLRSNLCRSTVLRRQPSFCGARRPVVIQSVRVDQAKVNPYIPLLVNSMSHHVTVRSFSWPLAILGRYDLLHVHWPEGLYRGSSFFLTSIKRFLSVLLLSRITVGRIQVVQTVHNVRPHIREGRVDALLREWIDKRTELWISLNRHSGVRGNGRSVVIPHGHYRDWYSGHAQSSAETGRVLFFGILRPYKNVESLIAAVQQVEDPETYARICGYPAEKGYSEKLQELAAAAPGRVDMVLRHLTDLELTEEIGRSALVVLPYEEMHNSGAMLLALSLNRPVLVPRNSVTDDLANEVGAEWVLRYDGELSSEVLQQSLKVASKALESGREPYLDNRNWDRVGETTASHMRGLLDGGYS